MNRKRIESALTYINTVSTIILGILGGWLAYSTYGLQVASTRADISILLYPPQSQNWNFTSLGAHLTVNGTLSNEGSRRAIVEEMQLSMIYNFSGGTYVITMTYSDPSKECGWSDHDILQKESKPFSLTMYINSYIWVDPGNGRVIGIGSTKSDKITISVRYDDGKGELTNTKEFDAI
jgi:hypothetical protein